MIELKGSLVVKGQDHLDRRINAVYTAIDLADSQIRAGEWTAPKVHIFSNKAQEKCLYEQVETASAHLSAVSDIQITISTPSATDNDPFHTLLYLVANNGPDILVIDEPECWGVQDVYEESIEILSEHVDIAISTRRSKDKL